MGSRYQYANASSSQHGLMQCACCGKAIIEGEYRHRMFYSPDGDSDKDRFITHHRGCSSSDPGWAKLNAHRRAEADKNSELLSEAKSFRDKWNIFDLDELIDNLEGQCLTCTT